MNGTHSNIKPISAYNFVTILVKNTKNVYNCSVQVKLSIVYTYDLSVICENGLFTQNDNVECDLTPSSGLHQIHLN